tara:strand:+ start:385 stop:855 length:471 start_codon:yes stop_codon:yes gene_type:complete
MSSPGLEDVKSPRIQRVFDYWAALRRDRPFPAWPDVKLMDIYDVAPFLAVLDVEDENGAARFRYRFCGTTLVEARSSLAPADPTGRWLDEIAWPFDPAPLLVACAKVVNLRKPGLLAAGEVNESAYHLHERGFFPLGSSDDAVSQIIVCVDETRAA